VNGFDADAISSAVTSATDGQRRSAAAAPGQVLRLCDASGITTLTSVRYVRAVRWPAPTPPSPRKADLQHDHRLHRGADAYTYNAQSTGEAAVKFGRVWRDERGASALEFGLIAPVFFLSSRRHRVLGLLFWTSLGMQQWSSDGRAMCQRQQDALPQHNPAAITQYATQQTYV